MSHLLKANTSLVHIFRQTLATNVRLMSTPKTISNSLLTVKKDLNVELMDKDIKEHNQKLSNTLLTTEEPMDITTFNGVPEEHTSHRRVIISKKSKNAMQSGTEDTKLWRIEFECRERWENPLMGWTSTGDPLSNLNVWFATKEDAQAFCAKNGWYYEVSEPQQRRNLNPNYSQNFSWNKRTRVGTK